MAAPRLTVFSDFSCPFSRVTEAALRRAVAEHPAEVAYRAYELFPAPAPLAPVPVAAWRDALRPLVEELGIRLEPPPLAVRTRKAHEAARFARARSVEPALREAIFTAYWADGRDIARIDLLAALGAELGLDAAELKIALDIDAFADEVAADRAYADRLGIRQTPTLLVERGAGAELHVGALGLDELRALLTAP